MTAMILDSHLEQELRRERQRTGADRYDEVWDGVYVMSPMANNAHQSIVGKMSAILTFAIELPGLGRVLPGANVSDHPSDWTKNYRCPDVVVYLNDNPAENRETHWYGGPDLAVEVISLEEDPYAKLDFYAGCNTQELLIVHRRPWRLELFRNTGTQLQTGAQMQLVGTSELDGQKPGAVLTSERVAFSWRLVTDGLRPQIEMTNVADGKTWRF